ncbi:unnamed protein product [Rotaria magnacalcarata]|uniref:Uncharacterized protein n=2 Tax=Rotaria magnacalcarata TaxID=392030 RepID=A0A816R1X6_9BILA|nr:unnamed protein product [Rotaria magnacalcarata]
MVESISKNNYQFIKNCEKYFDFNSPEQVVLSSPNEPIELTYFIPIDSTLSFMLKSPQLLLEISENIQQQRINVEHDSDLMFSIRDVHYGNRFDEDNLLIQLYLDDIGLTNPVSAKRDKHKMTMGVIGPSPLRELIGFHATTSLPRDLMHDFIEGICPVIIISLLKQASALRIITYIRIQERMENFQYGKFDSSNQPPPLLVKHLQKDHMVATAAQKLCFFKLFPIISNDVVDLLPSFIVYKVLREILDLLLLYPFRKKWLHVLGELCETFYETMLSHFPDKITPKAHFIREYKYMINDFGPAVR